VTAEVIVMNMQAVAMAADSAVTIGTVGEQQKIFNSANKLFMLSIYHPVGVMIYNNATLMGVPWETLIGIYRRELGNRSFQCVLDYANHFFEFLQAENPRLFPEEGQELVFNRAVRSYFEQIKSRIDERVREQLTGTDSLEDEASMTSVSRIVATVIQEHYDQWHGTQLCENLDEDFRQEVKRRYDALLVEAINNVFEQQPVTESSVNQLKEIAASIVCSREYKLPSYTGIVFAGFGDEQLFPACLAYNVDAFLAGRLIYHQNVEGCHTSTLETPAAVQAFAQQDVVTTFVEGVHPYYRDAFHSLVTHVLVQQYPAAIAGIPSIPEMERASVIERLGEIGSRIAAQFRDTMNEYLRRNYMTHLIQAVMVMPKDELAALAQALVNITSVKRKVSMEAETVGGPVDVAVISKKDGFIWISRKHYFDADHNPHFFRNYYRSNQTSGGADERE
jgi:hypothetical protein